MPTFWIAETPNPSASEKRERWYQLLSLKKSHFSTREIGPRFYFSQNSKNHVNQIFKIYGRIVILEYCMRFLLSLRLHWDNFDFKLPMCYKNLPFRAAPQVQKLCDGHDCCISFATQNRPSSLNISSYQHLACRIYVVKSSQNWPKISLVKIFPEKLLRKWLHDSCIVSILTHVFKLTWEQVLWKCQVIWTTFAGLRG